jgi:multiple sugar transport system permease protein/sn-glycerol 3-phosphate transport system permease protein
MSTTSVAAKVSASQVVKKEGHLSLYLFTLPIFIFLGGFNFYPAFRTFFSSLFFTSRSGDLIEFVGTENFVELFQSDSFWNSIWVSCKFSLITVTSIITISVFLGVIAHEKIKGTRFFKTIFSSSIGVSSAAASVIWLFFFSPNVGIINKMLLFFNLPEIDWLRQPTTALIAVSIVTIWMNIGFSFLIVLSALAGISSEIYESADIDGAGYFRKLFKITIPLISPNLFYLFIVTTIKSLQTFGQVDILTSGGPAESTNLIVYQIWKTAFVNGRYDEASAMSVILFLIVGLITTIQFKLERRVHYQ